jgi:uncharacterized protein (TIGR00297 family)
VGTAILTGAGWEGGAVLLAFFIPSSVISRLIPEPGAAALDTKGSRRDHVQVLANGAAAAVAALAASPVPGLGLWIVTSSLAAAASDTWATSWGAGSAAPPRDILSGRPVRAGTNGGVTVRGTLGGVAGAGFVALIGAVAGGGTRLLVTASLAGILGMLADSALGAARQGRFRCPACDQETERRVHRCGTRTRLEGGWQWLDNDAVNALSTGLAAGLGWLAWAWRS